MPRIVDAPIRTPRAKEEKGPERDQRLFYEKEIEKNRQIELPVDVSGYSKKAPIPQPSGSNRPAAGVGNWRVRDEWVYGVTRIYPD